MMNISTENGSEVYMPVLQGFDCKDFNRRVDQITHTTPAYCHALQQAMMKACRIGALPPSPGPFFTPSDIPSHIKDLVSCIANAGIRSVVIESAHAYAFDSLHDPAVVYSLENQLEQASLLSKALQAINIETKKVLFVDNYNPSPSREPDCNLDIPDYLKFAQTHGFSPDYLIMEADMVPLAEEIIASMQLLDGINGQNLHNTDSIFCKENNIMLNHRHIELAQICPKKISCSAIDAALTVLKYRFLGDGVVNILPKLPGAYGFSYRSQQQKVRLILREHLRSRVLPFFNIFCATQRTGASTLYSFGAHQSFRKRIVRTG